MSMKFCHRTPTRNSVQNQNWQTLTLDDRVKGRFIINSSVGELRATSCYPNDLSRHDYVYANSDPQLISADEAKWQ